MKNIFLILFAFFLLSFQGGLILGQPVATYYVYPYTDKVLPEEPLVYYPVTGLSFNPSNISIKDAQGKIPDTNEVKIIFAKPFYNTSYNTDKSEGTGYPASLAAKILFKKPGKSYEISFTVSPGCGNCTNPAGSYPSNRKILGNNEFKVQVMYPNAAFPIKLNEFYLIGKELTVNFAANGLVDNPDSGKSYYSYDFTFLGETKTFNGPKVTLDTIFANPDYSDSVFVITGKYRGEIIEYSPTEKAIFRSKLRFNPENLVVKHTWSENKNNIKELSISDKINFDFEFKYEDELPDGRIFNYPMQGFGEGEPRIELNGKNIMLTTKKTSKKFILSMDDKIFNQLIGKVTIFKLQFTDTFGKTINKELYAIFNK